MTTVLRAALADALAEVAPAIPTRPQVPILAAVEIEFAPGSISLRATDFHLTIWRVLAADCDTTATVHVSGHRLKSIVAAFSAKHVSLTMQDGSLVVECGSARYRMSLMASEEFPARPALPAQSGVVDGARLADALRRIKHASGGDEIKDVQGMQVWGNDPELVLSSTDRFALAEVAIDYKGLDFTSRLLYADMLTAARVAGDGEVSIHAGDSSLALVSPAGGTMTRLIDAPYPSFAGAIQRAGGGGAYICDRVDLRDALKRAALVIVQNGSVHCTSDGASLRITAHDETSDIDELIDVEPTDGSSTSLLVNPDYFAALLDGIDTEQVEIDAPAGAGALRATGITPDGPAPHIHVLFTKRI